MGDTATNVERTRRRAGSMRLVRVCVAFVALQVAVVTVMLAHARGVTAGLLTMVTVVVVITVAMEASFKRAEVRAAEAAPRSGSRAGSRAGELPRRPRERFSPLIQRAYYLARNDSSASHIARSCDIPEAFAVLIIDDVRRTAPRRGRAARNASGRAARNSSGRAHSDGRKPKNPPAI